MLKTFSTIFFFSLISIANAAPDSKVVGIEQEPNHRPVAETAFLRVFDAYIPSGKISLFHTHNKDSFFFCIDGAEAASEEPDKAIVPRPAIKSGDIYFRAYSKKEFVHRVINNSQNPFRILDIEALDVSHKTQFKPLQTELESVIDNDAGRVSKFVLSPGQKLKLSDLARGLITTRYSGKINISDDIHEPISYQVYPGWLNIRNTKKTIIIENVSELPIEFINIEM